MNLQKKFLKNGMPLLALHVPGYTISSFIAFPAGSRYETKKENGIAHALEHMVFKGGEIWSDYTQVNKQADSLGLHMNAFTSQDTVAFYAKSRAEDASEALNLLTDFVARPQLRSEEWEKEKEVIVQEIAMYNDRPSYRADELLEKATYGNHPMARPIAGTPESVRSFSIKDIQSFKNRTWNTTKGVIVIVGDLEKAGGIDSLSDYVERFEQNSEYSEYQKVEQVVSNVLVEAQPTEQSHLRMYYPVNMQWENGVQRTAFSLLTSLLGGSMSSVLFDEIREKRGLCYNIGSFASLMPDHQGLSISSGLQTDQTVQAFQLIRQIVEKDLHKFINDESIERAKRFLLGSMAMSRESTNGVAQKIANAHINGLPTDLDIAFENLGKVEKKDVLYFAEQLKEAPLVVACVGNHQSSDFS